MAPGNAKNVFDGCEVCQAFKVCVSCTSDRQCWDIDAPSSALTETFEDINGGMIGPSSEVRVCPQTPLVYDPTTKTCSEA